MSVESERKNKLIVVLMQFHGLLILVMMMVRRDDLEKVTKRIVVVSK